MKEHYVFLIIGHFGSGKSSIVNYYPHTLTEDGVTTKVQGLLSIAGKRGADDFVQYGITKDEFFKTKFSIDSDYIIHGNVFANFIDLLRYRKTHNLVVFVLRNSYEVLFDRVKKRNEKTNFNIKKFITMENRFNKNISFCKFLKGITLYDIDNDRTLNEVSRDVWDKIFVLLNIDKL